MVRAVRGGAIDALAVARGANNTLQRFGGAFGVAVVAAVFAAHGQLHTPAGFDAGFQPALAVAAGLSLLGALSALLVRGRTRTRLSPPSDVAPAPAT